MKTIKYCVILVLTVIFYSCNHLGKSASADFSNVIQIMYDTINTKQVKLEQIVNNCSFVKLETNSNCLIGSIDKLIFADSLIIIVDKTIAKTIYVFDSTGHFKNKVSRVGNASNEFLKLADIFVNSESEICLVDNAKTKIMAFSYDGSYLYSKDNPYPNYEMDYIDNNRLALFTSFNLSTNGNKKVENSCYAVVDKELNPVYTFGREPYADHPSFYMTRNRNLFRFDDKVYCTLNFGNVIYELGPDSVTAKYKLSITPGVLYEPKDEDFESGSALIQARNDHPYFIGNFFECDNYSFFNYFIPDAFPRSRWIIYNHRTETVLSLSNKTIDPILDFFYCPIARYGDRTLVEPVSATNICMAKEYYEKKGIHSEKLDELFEGMSVDSNPVLFFYDIDLGDL